MTINTKMKTELVPSITESSLWDQADHVVRVWITFLAKKDENGYVRSTYRAMKSTANLSNDPEGTKFDEAINILESPDPNSQTKKYEGRRIKRVDGGWIVLNHDLYKPNEIKAKERTRNVPYVPLPKSAGIEIQSNWKERCSTYEKYAEWENEEYLAILGNAEWIRERGEFHPNLDILLTLKKAHVDYWSQKAGWKNIKARKCGQVDWRATWTNALTLRCNQVWQKKNDQASELDETFDRLEREGKIPKG